MSVNVAGRQFPRWIFGTIGTLLAAAWCCGPFAGQAGASPTIGLVYSVDNGSSWSSNVNAAPGQTVIVRIFVANDTARAIAGSSVSTTVPSGFSRLAGTTRVCLNPGSTNPSNPSTEMACNTDAGRGGPINETSVWSGSKLVISPSAGLLAQGTGRTSGPLQIGQKKYLSLVNCDYRRFGEHYTDSIATTPNSARLGASTTASNTAVLATRCGPGDTGNVEVGANSATQSIKPLSKRYLSLENCDYRRTTDHYTDSISSTRRSARFGAGTAASNSRPSAPNCGSGGLGYALFGRSFVQFEMKAAAPASSTVYHQTAQLTAGTTHPTGAGTITVNASVSTPLGDAGVAVVAVAVVTGVSRSVSSKRRRTAQRRTGR